MTTDPSNYHREYSPYGSYSLSQFQGSDVISVLKNWTEYSFVFFNHILDGVRDTPIMDGGQKAPPPPPPSLTLPFGV